jgi:penicillin-binding protein 2
MKKPRNITKDQFTRRALILGSCKAFLLAGLFSRMFYLQIISNEKFKNLSEKNRIRTEIIPALRGKILDRNGVALAANQLNYTLVFEKIASHDKKSIHTIALRMGDILKLDPEEQADLINHLNTLSTGKTLTIKENLTWLELTSLELSAYELQGMYISTGFKRYYTYGSTTSHLTGYLGSISETELSKHSINLYPNLKIGKNGVEKTQDTILRGVDDFIKTEVNAKGRFIREIEENKGTNGQDIELAIDINLQQKASQLLGDTTGAILVSKISNGEIIASVSKPDFNPNLFNEGISANNWNKLINNPELPLINRAVSLTYPPGSGFKINVAIAALKENFDPETTFTCPGYHMVGDRMFQCWKKTGHGKVNLFQAIAGSCNVYFWNVARIIGAQAIANTARLMGYGNKLLDNEMPREQPGIIPDHEWKMKHIGTKWTLSDSINMAIGQGYVESTPIQGLTMVSRIASGKKITPSFMKQKNHLDCPSLNLDKELEIVREGMKMTVNTQIGTAYMNRILEPNLAMAGKTGTSQVISKRHKDDDLSRENVVKKIRNHGIFVAYAPVVKPEYAFFGIIEHGGFPSLAIKIAKEVLTEAQLKNI